MTSIMIVPGILGIRSLRAHVCLGEVFFCLRPGAPQVAMHRCVWPTWRRRRGGEEEGEEEEGETEVVVVMIGVHRCVWPPRNARQR